MYKKLCTIFTGLVFIFLAYLHYLIRTTLTRWLFAALSLYTLIYYFYVCILNPQREIIQQSVNLTNVNIQLEPDINMLKVNNISELNNNYDNTCCICLENIDPIDSYKLNDCNYHLYHDECIKLYIKNGFKKCPICNI